eukprot:6744572-Prymnesium_polylepis.1
MPPVTGLLAARHAADHGAHGRVWRCCGSTTVFEARGCVARDVGGADHAFARADRSPVAWVESHAACAECMPLCLGRPTVGVSGSRRPEDGCVVHACCVVGAAHTERVDAARACCAMLPATRQRAKARRGNPPLRRV